jgi:hypothetical protein
MTGRQKITPVRGEQRVLDLTAQPDFSQEVDQGSDLYRQFNGYLPARVKRVAHNRLIPPIVVELGELAGIIYRSDKWQPGQPRTYIHFMETPARLVCNVEGTQLYIVGGSYRITSRGIEG